MTWLVTAIAGKLAVSKAVVVAGAAILGSTAAGSRGQYLSGKQQEIEFKRQAEEERISAQSQELQRREALNRALAANIVGQGMAGISGEGSLESLSLASAEKAGLSEATIGLSNKLRQAALERQGKYAKQAGYMQAASTLLKGGSEIAQLKA